MNEERKRDSFEEFMKKLKSVADEIEHDPGQAMKIEQAANDDQNQQNQPLKDEQSN